MRRLARSGLAGGLALVCSACGAGKSAPPVAQDARLVVVVRLCGGPANQCFLEKMSVFVANAQHGVVASALRANGPYSFAVPPGRYNVTARDGVVGRRSVDAVAHKTTHVDIVINIK